MGSGGLERLERKRKPNDFHIGKTKRLVMYSKEKLRIISKLFFSKDTEAKFKRVNRRGKAAGRCY